MTIDRFFIRSVLSQFSLGILVLLVFFGVFKGLQDNRVYESSLGRISDNYQRIGTFNDQTITKSTEPYNEISNENLSNWDAAIYRCVSELMYQPSLDCYGSVRGAFFPLFPLIWRVTNLDARGVCLLNYLLFIISISALTQLFLKTSPLKMNLVYLALATIRIGENVPKHRQ